MYFGYTFCPDACPTSLLLMETAIDQLGPGAASKVNLVFITIDPERDTPELIKGACPLVGQPDEVIAHLRTYEAAGVDEVVVLCPTAASREVFTDLKDHVMARY